jgi:hypothetical protein
VLRGAKDAVEQLSRPGPHQVLRGDLGMVGIPGVVYAPAEGLGLPAVAFAHDWLQPPQRYADLLRHLASWGFVAAAPGSHRGPLPSHSGSPPTCAAPWTCAPGSGWVTAGSASTRGAPRSPGTASAAASR